MRNLQKDFFSLAKFLNEFRGNKGISSFKGIFRPLKALCFLVSGGLAGCEHTKGNQDTSKFS